MTKTRLSRRISCRSPSEIAWRYVFSGHAYLWCGVSRSSGVAYTPSSSVAGSGMRRLLGARGCASFRSFLTPARDLVLLLVGEVGVLAQPGAEALDRIALGPLLEQLLGDVEGVVVDGVALHAERQALDQRRPAALARLLDRALRLAVDGEHVGAVDDHALEAVGLRAVGEVLDGVLEVRRRRVRPLVVVADEHDREAPHAGEVHPLVRVAARGRALAEPADRDALLLADPERERAADGDREHRRQVADHRDQAEPRVGHVHVAVPALRRPVRRGPCTARRSATARRRA